MPMMQAAVMHGPGGPEVLNIETIPVPVPKVGQVLIKVMAFGLNRSELFTRQGHSPGVQFPRAPGIEAVGIVEQAPGGQFAPGDTVATVMGSMGRQFDGAYAEFTCVPANQVRKFSSDLPWEVLGPYPKCFRRPRVHYSVLSTFSRVSDCSFVADRPRSALLLLAWPAITARMS